MARSQRSPHMRVQWREEDSPRTNPSTFEGARRSSRRRSPTASHRESSADIGVKIKGRATKNTPPRASLKRRSPYRGRQTYTNSNHSPGRHGRGTESFDRHRDQKYHRRERSHQRQPESDLSHTRRRRRTRSPHHKLVSHRDSQRDRSPVYSRHLDRVTSPSRRREVREQSQSNPRADYYAPSREDNLTSAGDSYVPTNRRHRSRSPPFELSRDLIRSRRRSRSPRPSSYLKGRDQPSPRGHKPREDPSSRANLTYDKRFRSQASSPGKLRGPPRHRNPSNALEEEINRTFRKRKSSPSPRAIERPSRKNRKMQSSPQPIQSILDEASCPPSPPRPIPSFNSDSHSSEAVRESFPMHGMKASEVHSMHRPGRPQINTQNSYSTSPQWTPTSSHHGSPQSGSPFSHGRGSWAGQHQQYHGQPNQPINAYSPPYRQNSYPQASPQSHYHPNNQQVPFAGTPQQGQTGFQAPPFRGGHSSHRGNGYHSADRRFSGSGPPTYGPQPTRGRGGHFQNLQWTASGGNRSISTNQQSSTHTLPQPQGTQRLTQSQPEGQSSVSADDEDNPFRPSKDLQVEDQSVKETTTHNGSTMPPPSRQTSGASHAKESTKFSFAFKAKTTSAPAKAVPDLSQRMKEPSRKESILDNSKTKTSSNQSSREPDFRPRPDQRNDARFDRFNSRRERDYRDDYRSRDYRYERDHRDDRRSEYRSDKRSERDLPRARDRERSPEPKFEKKIVKRLKPQPTLPPEFAESTSVYYRKPGNESVVGSGTYGKVFKAIHVYTKNMVALKKIRMDGEKDGFPVTAIREIKLLQSLKHDNVVSLQEVMVENNDCFMVFEYLSHDLTGLLNHPTFKLEHSHKKHLSRQLFEGLNHLHRRGVLHRDIKAANILVSSTGLLKLADFGLARFYSKSGQPDYTNRVITIWYRSPELLLGETQYGPAVDIWSAACVMIEIFTRHAIFPGDGGEINQLDKIYNVLGTPTRSDWPGLVDMAWFELLRPAERKFNCFAEKYQERLTPAAFDLLQTMFSYDPAKRPTAGDVLEHSYFVSEEPEPKQAFELKDLQGDWHEFESKALRKENERKNQEARRAARTEEHQKEKEKRRASGHGSSEREAKRPRPSSSHGGLGSN